MRPSSVLRPRRVGPKQSGKPAECHGGTGPPRDGRGERRGEEGGVYLPLFGYHEYQDLNDYENYDNADELKATLELEDDLYGDEDDSFENNTST